VHHSFDINLATEYGVHSAIIIHHFQHWITFNKRTNRNLHDGRTWSYQTLDDIAAHFPYLSKSQVYELIERLCSGKGRRSKKDGQEFEPILIKGNYNKTAFDKTTWYAFKNEEKFIVLAQAKIDGGSSQNPCEPEPTPIPHTIQHTKTTVCSRENGSVPADADSLRFVKSCKKKHPDGHIQEISMESILIQSVQKKSGFTLDEIELAWEALIKTNNPVRDPYRFIEGTITNIRNSTSKQNGTKERNPCQKDLSSTAHLTKQSGKPKENYLVSGSIPPTFLKYSYETMIAKKS